MKISEDYEEIMNYDELPERFRAGFFGLYEYEIPILRGFVDDFYESVKSRGYVSLEDFTEFMAFLDVLRPADTDPVQNILTYAFSNSHMIASALRKGDPGSVGIKVIRNDE
ncbi:MAG: hypothetical protein IJM17_05440 [Firmicutes bacterium]|nr:hypothetical protein [Bacillota bacterium]